MAKVLTAKDYENRKVIWVCMNPDDPEQVHEDGSAHSRTAPIGTDENLRPWEWCGDCVYNWDVREFVWTGDQMYKRSIDNRRILKSNKDLQNEIDAELSGPVVPHTITALENILL